MASSITLTPTAAPAAVVNPGGNFGITLAPAVVQGGGSSLSEVEPATCLPTDLVGTWVYIQAQATPAGYQVTAADAAAAATCQCIGVIVNKTSATQCSIQRFGASPPIFTGLVAGARYFLGHAGAILAPPITDPTVLYILPVGVAVSPTVLVITPSAPLCKRDG